MHNYKYIFKIIEILCDNCIIITMDNKVNNQKLKYEKALGYEIFEKEEYGFAKEKIRTAECIFDVWWHIWLFSQWCRSFNSKAKIHYFEPVKQFYDVAEDKFCDDENIILNNFWVGVEYSQWIMLINEKMIMQSSKYPSFLNPKWKECAVKFISLKEYLKSRNIGKIDVLKMDIEWMEFEVLSSWTDYEWQKIDNMVVEIHLLNEKMKSEWNQIFLNIKSRFRSVKIITSWYRDEIFLIWAEDNLYW